jgi:serine/threonine-protein kinase RsbW
MAAGARVEFALPARAENVPLIRHALAGLAEAVEMDPGEIADLKTVVTEACMNAVVHAYADLDEPGPLEVEAWRNGSCLVVVVRDYGRGIRPLADVERRSLRLGLPLIAALTDSFEVSGEPERGTEVTMKVPLSTADRGDGDAPIPEADDQTRINVPAGELLSPVLSRVISMFAARADLSVDQLSDAVLLSDAISAQGPAGFRDGTARIAVREEDGAFSLRVGPLGAEGAEGLLRGLRIPSLNASLEDLADDVSVEETDEGEMLALRISRN